MSDGKKYYCFCSSNCKYETMTKEQILAAIAQATGFDNVDPDAGFITRVKEKNGGNYVTFWVGTQAQYNAIESKDTNCLYIITDDTTSADFMKALQTVNAVDITDNIKITVTEKPAGFEEINIEKCFMYSKASGVVHFNLWIYGSGAFAKGEELCLDFAGAPKPYRYNKSGSIPCSCYPCTISATAGGTNALRIWVYADEDGETNNTFMYVSGWYFFEGE